MDSMVVSFLGMTCDRAERDVRGIKRHARLNQATKKQRTAFQERSVRCLKKCIWAQEGKGMLLNRRRVCRITMVMLKPPSISIGRLNWRFAFAVVL